MTIEIIKPPPPNPYMKGTFKREFVDEWYRKFKPGKPLPPIPIALAEAFSIFLRLVEKDIQDNDVTEGMTANGDTEQVFTAHGQEAAGEDVKKDS